MSQPNLLPNKQTNKKPEATAFLPSHRADLPKPNWQILKEITELSDRLKQKQLELGQKKLLLESTKKQLSEQIKLDEKDLKQKIVVVKKRENISNFVEKLRQQEQDLQTRIKDKITSHPDYQKLKESDQSLLSETMINKLMQNKL
jgi:hypothetical protein